MDKVTPQALAQRNLQRERQQRGDDFQEEIRRSWRRLPNCWRMRIADGGGASRPADELILLEEINVLAEQKRTAGDVFRLGMLRENQITGLVDFDEVISRNLGLVFISFLNEKKGIDKTYVFRLLTAFKFMKAKGRVSIKLEEFERKKIPCVYVPLLDAAERTYDLKGVLDCYRYL